MRGKVVVCSLLLTGIRVVLLGQVPKHFFDLVLGRIAGDSKGLIVVALFHVNKNPF